VGAGGVPAAAAAPTDAAASGRALAEALASYLDGYERSWAGFVDDLRLRHATSDGDAIRQAQTLAARDGPLAALLGAVAQQTYLHKVSAPNALGDAAAPLERLVEDRFAPLRELTQQGATGAGRWIWPSRPSTRCTCCGARSLRRQWWQCNCDVARTARDHPGRFTAFSRARPVDAARARRFARAAHGIGCHR